MGLKADNAQLGQSNTASQNFNLRAPLDGTLRVDRGNEGAVLSTPIKIESNNDITLLGNLLSGVFGAGQTWKSVTRVIETTYINTTGKAIAINLRGNANGASGAFECVIGGISQWGQFSGAASAWCNALFIIPAGASYVVNGSFTSIAWAEFN